MQSTLGESGRARPGVSKVCASPSKGSIKSAAWCCSCCRECQSSSESRILPCMFSTTVWRGSSKRFCFLILLSRYHITDFKKAFQFSCLINWKRRKKTFSFGSFPCLPFPHTVAAKNVAMEESASMYYPVVEFFPYKRLTEVASEPWTLFLSTLI